MASEIMALLKSDNQKTEEEEFLKQEEVDTKRNKIDLMKLNSMIERLENPINPLSVTQPVTRVRRDVKV